MTRIIPICAIAVLLTGCVGTGPYTQRGAVIGGVAGAVVGNNNSVGTLEGAALGALAGAVLGNSLDHEHGTIYQDREWVEYPTPFAEPIPPMPGPGHVWMPGYWRQRPDGWVWIYGYWRREDFSARWPLYRYRY